MKLQKVHQCFLPIGNHDGDVGMEKDVKENELREYCFVPNPFHIHPTISCFGCYFMQLYVSLLTIFFLYLILIYKGSERILKS